MVDSPSQSAFLCRWKSNIGTIDGALRKVERGAEYTTLRAASLRLSPAIGWADTEGTQASRPDRNEKARSVGVDQACQVLLC